MGQLQEATNKQSEEFLSGSYFKSKIFYIDNYLLSKVSNDLHFRRRAIERLCISSLHGSRAAKVIFCDRKRSAIVCWHRQVGWDGEIGMVVDLVFKSAHTWPFIFKNGFHLRDQDKNMDWMTWTLFNKLRVLNRLLKIHVIHPC